MPPDQLSIEALPGWAHLNGVGFLNVKLDNIEGKGIGLVASQKLTLAADDEGAKNDAPLLKVPRDLILSAESVSEFAKVDQHFKQLLEAVGHVSSRSDILLYLLAQVVGTRRGREGSRGVASTPWTEYIKFLPRQILVPTLWTETERDLLKGTSLEHAVNAKLTALTSEFEDLREKSSELPFWNSMLWENETATIDDWALVDAWFRSRCLELPTAGEAMVPSVDMANHSNKPDAYYDEDSDGDVEILLRPGFTVPDGGEVTISYGEFKSAAEMLFSYGFIDPNTSKDEMTLALESFPDDPLAQAKIHIYGGLPTVRLSRTDGTLAWDCPFLHLMCLNEEDGLEFRILQDNDGGRQLRLFWQEEDVTCRASEFEELTQDHPMRPLFRLRAVTVLHEQMAAQLERIRTRHIDDDQSGADPRSECVQAADVLRELEGSLLESAVEALQQEQSNLLAEEQVKAYLGSTEDSPIGQDSTSGANEEEDFS